MAFFMNPGAMFLGSLGTSEQKFLVNLIQGGARAGYKRFVEPCAGTLAMSNLAVQNGFKPSQVEASDVALMPSILGYAVTDQSLKSLRIHAEGYEDDELIDPATALYAQLCLRISKIAGSDYYYNLLMDLKKRKREHIKDINDQISAAKGRLSGMKYIVADMWDHISQAINDPEAMIIVYPPTYVGGYEKLYDTCGRVTWDEPSYDVFDQKTGYQKIYELSKNAKALVICCQETKAGMAVGDTIYGRSGAREGFNAYITANRQEEAAHLSGGKKIKRAAESKPEPLECSIMPTDWEITEESDIKIVPIKQGQALYYRALWTHNFVGSQATWNRALIVDGYIAAVFGMSKMAEDSMFVWYVMKAPHNVFRIGRLCYMLAQNKTFTEKLLDEIDCGKVTKIKTAMLTKHPENKEVRGIMKLTERREDKINGYKLTYEAVLIEKREEKDTLKEWLRREKEWQKARVTR